MLAAAKSGLVARLTCRSCRVSGSLEADQTAGTGARGRRSCHLQLPGRGGEIVVHMAASTLVTPTLTHTHVAGFNHPLFSTSLSPSLFSLSPFLKPIFCGQFQLLFLRIKNVHSIHYQSKVWTHPLI